MLDSVKFIAGDVKVEREKYKEKGEEEEEKDNEKDDGNLGKCVG